jgi:hypothetical protein
MLRSERRIEEDPNHQSMMTKKVAKKMSQWPLEFLKKNVNE